MKGKNYASNEPRLSLCLFDKKMLVLRLPTMHQKHLSCDALVVPAVEGCGSTKGVLWAGEHAKAMEKCSDGEVERGVAALLAAYPAIPCPAAAAPRIIRSAWGSDPLFRGSYSYVNAAGSPDDIDALAAPLTVNLLTQFSRCTQI